MKLTRLLLALLGLTLCVGCGYSRSGGGGGGGDDDDDSAGDDDDAAGLVSCPGDYGLASAEWEAELLESYPDIQILTDLSDIADCEVIEGGLLLWRTSLTKVDGLPNLTSMGYLSIFENDALTNIDGLSSLTSVGSYLSISDNDALTKVDGLMSLTSVGLWLVITYNAALTDVDGLLGLSSVGGALTVVDNDALTNISGLSSLTSVGSDLNIQHNPVLCQSFVDAFVAACTIGGSVSSTLGNDTGC
jgi:hypothetical protein